MTDSGHGSLRTAIADLHCHYPMHFPETAVPPEDEDPFEEMRGFEQEVPNVPRARLSKRIRQRVGRVNRLRAWLLKRAAHKSNEPSHEGHDDEAAPRWRVDFDGLRAGNVRFVLSVLCQPFAELDLGRWPEGRPERGYMKGLTDQLDAVERDLRPRDQALVIKSAADLETAKREGQTAFFHSVEGGFHLGPTVEEVQTNVRVLAERGVAYITLAHLFFRQVAKNTPALPFLSDRWYGRIFWQWGRHGLTDLGRAAVTEMYHQRVLIDVSHMRADAIDEVLDLIEGLDRETKGDPTDFPLIATHVGYRFGDLSYNLDPCTIQRIARRGGLIGLILSQHLMNDGIWCESTRTIEDSMFVIKAHIDEIARYAGGYDTIAIGSDLDGFIKPTLSGFETVADLAQLVPRLEELYPWQWQKILSGNALRVLERVYSQR